MFTAPPDGGAVVVTIPPPLPVAFVVVTEAPVEAPVEIVDDTPPAPLPTVVGVVDTTAAVDKYNH